MPTVSFCEQSLLLGVNEAVWCRRECLFVYVAKVLAISLATKVCPVIRIKVHFFCQDLPFFKQGSYT